MIINDKNTNTSVALENWKLNSRITKDVFHGVVTSLGMSLPADYVQFLQEHNGGEGFIGDNYLILWRAEEIPQFNREYEVDKYAPGIILFGSDGGGEGYGFDSREKGMPIVRVPFIGMDLKYATVVASSFNGLITYLSTNKNGQE